MDEHRRPETGSWREQLMLTLTHWGAIFGGVIAIGVTIRALAFDFVDVSHPAFAAMFVGYGAIVALRLLPGLPYHVRAVTLSAACFIAAGGAVLLRGLAPAPVLLVGLGVLIAALFLGRAGMLGGLLLAGAIVAIVGRPEPPEAFNPWSNAIDVVCVAGVLTVLVQFVVSRLERSLEHSSQALERLQSEQALREHAQDQLTRAQATLQQTQKLDAVGRLAGGVAHDFNNTLQVVLGWTELLRSETHPQQIQDGIEQIRAAAERSRGLTRQLLAFSRPELNQPTRVELHAFLPALVKSYRRLLPDDISIVARTVEGLAILMDEGHLSQVLLNIVLNARDAMPAGGTIAVIGEVHPARRTAVDCRRIRQRGRRDRSDRHGNGHGRGDEEPCVRAVLHDQGQAWNWSWALDRLWRRSARPRSHRHPQRARQGHVGETVLPAADGLGGRPTRRATTVTTFRGAGRAAG